jgi:hypothetical protein
VSSDTEPASGATPAIVRVQHHPRGHWEVITPDRCGRISCETFDDARRIAFLTVAHGHSCELIIRDAYNRIVEHELIDVHQLGPTGPRSQASTRDNNPGGHQCRDQQ